MTSLLTIENEPGVARPTGMSAQIRSAVLGKRSGNISPQRRELCPCAAQEECISRKKFFNMMEDMKGKIRVYARVRPMLSFEQDRGHRNALNIPDELTLDHIWKDKKREYNFDAVFAPDASQDKVRC